MSKNQRAGAVLVFNPSGAAKMDLEENPRRGKGKRKNPTKKRRKAKRANPSHSAPQKRGRRRAKRANPSRRFARRRRNPSFPKIMTIATWTAGGAIAYGAVYALSKIPNLSVPVRLGVQAGTGLALAIGASFLSENLAAGMFGAWGFQIPGLALAGYNYYEATKAADKSADKLKDASKGTTGLLYGNRSVYAGRSAAAAQLRM